MILEIATLHVRHGESEAFEAAFAQAQTIISSMRGYVSHELHRSVERADTYVLLVRWQRLEDHTEGFRGSPDYRRWQALLHRFYDPAPSVEHFERVG